jgi:hypothetical protein
MHTWPFLVAGDAKAAPHKKMAAKQWAKRKQERA